MRTRIKKIFEEFLTEMPHETIDYEIERFTNPSIEFSFRWNSLQNFFKYLLVGDLYETENQPQVNLNDVRENIIDDMQEGLLKKFVIKNFFPNDEFASYGEFLKQIWMTATPSDKDKYYSNILGTMITVDEHDNKEN